MNYIVFDLEWNQCPYGKDSENSRLPFEIIEIGAVKLNEARQEIDRFRTYIKPKVYKKLHYHAAKVTGLSVEDLNDGMPFENAAREFLDWSGEDCIFCSWGEQDLTELQRNLKYYGMLDMIRGPMLYENIQLLYSMAYDEPELMRSLQYAVTEMGMEIESESEFHRALDDADYSAKIFALLPEDLTEKYPSVNTYQNPKKRQDEIYIEYDGFEQFVSREFNTKESAMADQRVKNLHCNICKRNIKPIISWYARNAKNYYALGKCKEHGYIKGKIHMMKTDEEKFYVIKTIEEETEEGAKEHIERKNMK